MDTRTKNTQAVREHRDSRRRSAVDHGGCQIRGLGSAFPSTSYSQAEIGQLFGLENRVVRRLLAAPHIRERRLCLPERDPATGRVRDESPQELHQKFRDVSLQIGGQAIERALDAADLAPTDVDCLMCVTTTGFMVPGLSSLLSRHLGFRCDLKRSDIVGMGCNAGLNGLGLLTDWANGHPGKSAMMVCCEVNSAAYIRDDTIRTGIVNSIFGDGAAAVVICARPAPPVATLPATTAAPLCPRLLDFESYCIPEHWDAMRFDWEASQHKWSFFLSRDIPYVVGFNVHRPVQALLARHGLAQEDIEHWAIHTGGGAVIDSVKSDLKLEEHDVRHTRSVLRDYGNISSGSFLVSLQRLHDEASQRELLINPGDYGVLLTMGPGAQLEAALIRY